MIYNDYFDHFALWHTDADCSLFLKNKSFSSKSFKIIQDVNIGLVSVAFMFFNTIFVILNKIDNLDFIENVTTQKLNEIFIKLKNFFFR